MQKGRLCPLIDGTRDKRLNGLSKMTEIGVLLIALFVLQEVRSGAIPFGCSGAAKTACLNLWQPDSQFVLGTCEDTRPSCYAAVGAYSYNTTVTQAGYPASYNSTFGFCQCLVFASLHADGVTPLPGYCVFSNIFAILVFVLGFGLVLVKELLLSRKATAVIMFAACEFYFWISYVIVGSLGWGNLCRGQKFDQLMQILLALVIGQSIFFFLSFVMMMMGAARKMPKSWVEYNTDKYKSQKNLTKLQRHSSRELNNRGERNAGPAALTPGNDPE